RPAAHAVDSRHPPRFSMHIVYSTFYCMPPLLACFEAHSGKSGTLLYVVTHGAPSVPRGANHRKQARVVRQKPPADARFFQTLPPPDVHGRIPYRNHGRPLAAYGVLGRAALVITLFLWCSSAALLGE